MRRLSASLALIFIVASLNAQVISTTNPAIKLDALVPLAHVEERGTGPVNLILIPGLACDWHVYDAFMSRNADKYHMYAVTLPGCVGTKAPPLPTGATYADNLWLNNAEQAVLALITERKLDQPVIIGHSLGGNLATRLAIKHGDKIRAALSIDGWPLLPPLMPGSTMQLRDFQIKQTLERLQNTSDEEWPVRQRDSIGRMVKSPDRAKAIAEMCLATPKANVIEYMAELAAADLRADLAKIRVPLLTLVALDSFSGSPENEGTRKMLDEQFAAAPANVRHVFFDDTRHFIMDDRPAELDEAVAAFVAGRNVAGVKATSQPGK